MIVGKTYQLKLTTCDQQVDLMITKKDQTYKICSSLVGPGVVICNVFLNSQHITNFSDRAIYDSLRDAVELIFCVFHFDLPPEFLTEKETIESACSILRYRRNFEN